MHNNASLNRLDKAPIGRLLWEYSVPAVVGIVVMSIYNVIDRIFIGHGVGPDAIAGGIEEAGHGRDNGIQ